MKTVSVFTATLAAVLATTGLLLWFDLVEATQTIPTYAALQAIDLYVEVFTMTPSSGRINEPVAFDIRICNAAGSDSIPGSRVNLYVDPPDQPPLTTTQKTKEFVQYVTWDPGICYTWQYQYSFGQSGKHVAYAWVDPYERIAESDEANNLVEIRFSIEPEIPPGSQDAYEPDDTCDQAQEINTDGTVQTHKFDPLGDVDWVRFQATAGQVYTITAVGTGADGYPTFEVWESCSIPPGSFGGTSFRLIWTASTSGEYYLKLDNDRDDYDPVESGYQLTIRGETVITGTQPSVEGISPAWGTNDRNTNVIISGTNFSAPPRASLCPYYPGTTAWCGDCTYPLQNTSWPGSDRIFAVVPANLPNGAYCLAVTNPGGKTDTLLDAFTVLPGQPDLWEIHPLRGYADAPNDLHVYGFNFHPDISVTLGITPLENVVVVNQTYLRGTAPAGLPPGDYTLRAFYETGDADILPGGYAVMAVNDDLFAQEGELWVDPVAPRAGETTRLGLLVHRESVTSALPTHVEVGVHFTVDDTDLGTVNVPLLPPDGQESTRRLEWTPPAAGEYAIRAIIDPQNQITEASEANNVVTRTVTVLTSTSTDGESPQVGSLLIKDSAQTTENQSVVTDTLVYLATTATDYPQAGGEGVTHLRYVEFEYSQGARLWIPVQDSGWIVSDTINANNYRWKLTPVGGIHYIQAWAKDSAGNISHHPHQERVNYLPSAEGVDRTQVRIYRQTLSQGEQFSATLTPISGDPDLYVWPPDWADGRDPWVSDSFTDTERLSFSAPVSGVYQIEVHGYDSAQYRLDIEVGTPVVVLAARAPTRIMGFKPWGRTPAVPPQQEPPVDTFPQEADRLYLPVVLRSTGSFSK